jgi:hypothetical protein
MSGGEEEEVVDSEVGVPAATTTDANATDGYLGCFRRHVYVMHHIARRTPANRIGHLPLSILFFGTFSLYFIHQAVGKTIDALSPAHQWVQIAINWALGLSFLWIWYLMLTQAAIDHLVRKSTHAKGGVFYDPHTAAPSAVPERLDSSPPPARAPHTHHHHHHHNNSGSSRARGLIAFTNSD